MSILAKITANRPLSAKRCDIVVHDLLLGTYTAASQQLAHRKASIIALDALELDPGFMDRVCHCRQDTLEKIEAAKIEAELEADDLELMIEMTNGREGQGREEVAMEIDAAI